MKKVYSFDFIGIRHRGDKVSFISSGSESFYVESNIKAQDKLFASLRWGHFDAIKHHPPITNRHVKTPKFPVRIHL